LTVATFMFALLFLELNHQYDQVTAHYRVTQHPSVPAGIPWLRDAQPTEQRH
jgi:hypothetical protein